MSFKKTLAGLLVAGTCLVGDIAKADYKWEFYNNHSYSLTNVLGSWQDAESEAVLAGGHLTTINDGLENDWLLSKFNATGKAENGDMIWIGFYQIPGSPEPAVGWEWISREPVTYTNWAGGEPNNHNTGEDFGTLKWDGFWNDWDSRRNDFHPVKGIIERETNSIPEPSTLSLLAIGAGIGAYSLYRRRKGRCNLHY